MEIKDGICCFGKKKEEDLILNSLLRVLHFSSRYVVLHLFMENCKVLVPKGAGEKRVSFICETSKDLSMDKTMDCRLNSYKQSEQPVAVAYDLASGNDCFGKG